jgi:hypothetical protein
MRVGLDSSGSGEGPVAGCIEHGDENAGVDKRNVYFLNTWATICFPKLFLREIVAIMTTAPEQQLKEAKSRPLNAGFRGFTGLQFPLQSDAESA